MFIVAEKSTKRSTKKYWHWATRRSSNATGFTLAEGDHREMQWNTWEVKE